MFRALFDLLTAPARPGLSADDATLALAVLLVRLARADDHYDTPERAHIDRILMHRRGISHPEAQAIRTEAETAERDAPDTVRFTRVLKERIAYEDRIEVIEALWDVALSDNERSPGEEALIRLVANLLGVADRDSALARQRIARGEV